MFNVYNDCENKTLDNLSSEFKDRYLAYMHEGRADEMLYHMKRELTVEQMEDAMLFLINFHLSAKNMLFRFWQRSSDACPLEATEAENEEKEWRKWVYKDLY